MMFGHERLDVYRVALQFVGFSHELLAGVRAGYSMQDQLMRAATSTVLNVAEGNGKRAFADRRRFFEIARGSATEAAAALDILVVCKVCPAERANAGKSLLIRVVSMLTKMVDESSGAVREDSASYESGGTTPNHDHDNDNDYDHDYDYDSRTK